MEEKFTVMELSSSSGTTKRSRAHSFGAQVPSCLVDGCVSDLSKCRDYHRRHKVCELHSKTPKVTIGGQERRFCQQCSRFHSLIEFDDGKRSCRKRLDGHNRRRRKPQPESIVLNSGRFPSYQDSKFFPFGIPQLFSTSDAVSSPWVGTVKAENDASSPSLLSFGDRRRSSSPSSSIPRYKGKQFPFLHGSRDPAIPEASICQSFLKPNYGSDNCSNSQKAYSDGLNRVIDSDRTRALSLLSTPAETREICFSSMVHQHSLNPPPVQSLIPNVHYSGLRMEEKNLNSSFISNESRNTNNIQQCHGMVSDPTMQLDGSSSSGPHQTLSFWE